MSFANKPSLFRQNNLLYSQFRTELTTEDFFPVNSCCVLEVNRITVGLRLVWLILNCCFWVVTLYFLTYHFAVKSPDPVEMRPKRINTFCNGNWKVNIVKI
jgi:hypothetical protein